MHERHGKRYSRVYRVWSHMKDRCLNPRNKSFRYYGGRGVGVCDRWTKSFTAFYEDMGDPPPRHSLDRINNDGSYCRENCRWANQRQQKNNTRSNRKISHSGETKTLMQWERATGINHAVIADRLNRGWATEKALTEPTAHTPKRQITFRGKTQNLSEWAREAGLSVSVLHERLNYGWSIKDAVTTPTGGRFHSVTFGGKTQTISAWSRETGISRRTIRRRLKRGLPLNEVMQH